MLSLGFTVETCRDIIWRARGGNEPNLSSGQCTITSKSALPDHDPFVAGRLVKVVGSKLFVIKYSDQ